ncbi:MAG TPA: Spy/CpxP family protein refolding chaperone [Trinickia sp.]|uniref:Spy/CpxP family protein refolding chaperone n=1 Tax=Trinickia sp. TaxID=2571163 RepID=UPI002CF753AE|nr:Spy/CpxP family protein refolding chaperone [Trinickia sp.]HVW50215.1 Spy/CpxP family protein refolding chaperone [Trinickia sp.]
MLSTKSLKMAALAAAGAALVSIAVAPTPTFAQASGARGSGGYGYGPGMMRGGNGYGPGMMGGGYGYGPGMMGGGYGYGYGPGMMGGGFGGGPGMMGYGGGWLDALGLSDEQRTKINRIQDDTRHAHWALMNSMMDQQAKLRDLYEAPKRDSAAIDDTYKTIGDLRQKMIDSSVEAHKRMEAVLTSKQREQLRTYREQDRWGW